MADVELGGTAYFKQGGIAYNARAAAKIKKGGPVKTPVMGIDGRFHGNTTKYMPGSITLTVSTGGKFSQQALRDAAGTQWTLELGNGKTYILPVGSLMEDPEEDVDEGSMTFTVAGQPLIELLAVA